MLPTQTEILPAKNIELQDQKQPEVYSLLTDTNKDPVTKKPRRRKPTKLNEVVPVMINPHITRSPGGVTFLAPHHRFIRTQESIPSFVSTNDPRRLLGLYLDNSYDSNNSLNHNQTTPPSMPFNSRSPVPTQQTFARSNDSLSVAHANFIPQMIAQSQLYEINRFLHNHAGERTVTLSPEHQDFYKHYYPSYTFTDQESLLDYSQSRLTPPSSTPISKISPVKPKRKYSKRVRLPVLMEQEKPPPPRETSPCPEILTQSTISNDLPSIIPSSVFAIPVKCEKHFFPMDTESKSNAVSLTPPSSSSSTKSSPVYVNNESSSIPMQQPLLPQASTEITEVNLSYTKLLHDQKPPYIQNTNSTIYNSPYRTIIPNVIPTSVPLVASSPMLSVATNATPPPPPQPTMTNVKEKRKKREKVSLKSEITQSPIVQKLNDEKMLTTKPMTTNMPVIKKRKHKKSHKKDIRTKKELRRFKDRNRLAVMKFMMEKRKQKHKQQKQMEIPTPNLVEVKNELIAPKLEPTHTSKLDDIEMNLPEIITPCLKISIGANEKIESISLSYHRRLKSNTSNRNSPIPSTIADNKLGLLIEAVEFIETLHGSSKFTTP
ncbi:unnamed protein product [Adineta steineri]|uniref:Uncharacterized protein n=1 Tax=Adineta steineri TaxID=433720 RepID=A0A818LKR0_9BILA|nr:unnamed protein product [Adineta steineri]